MIVFQLPIDLWFNNPLTALLNLSIPFLVSNIITLAGFLLATFFAIRYTRIFYEGRPLGRSWASIIYGLIVLSSAETGELLLNYRISPTFYEGALILGAQMVGIMLIAFGCYNLSKEIS